MKHKNIKIRYADLKYREEETRETSILYHLNDYEIFKGNKFFEEWDIQEHEFPKIITNILGKKYDLSKLEYSINLSDELIIDKVSYDGIYWISYYINFFSNEGFLIHSVNATSYINHKNIENITHIMNQNDNFDYCLNRVIIDKVFKQFSIQII